MENPDKKLMLSGLCIATLVFVQDYFLELGVAGAVPYVLVILLGLTSRSLKYFWYSAVVCSLLTLLGLHLSPSGGEPWKILLNRSYALAGIWITAWVCYSIKRKELGTGTALQKTQEEFRSVVDHAMDGIITIDETEIIRFFNLSAESMFGYKAEEVVGKNVSLLMTEPDRSEHDGYIKRYLRTGRARVLGIAREVTGLCKDGSTFCLEISVSEFFQGDQRMFIGIARDITERKHTEREIQSLSKFPGESPEPIMRAAKDGTLLYANKACFEVFWDDFFAVGKTLSHHFLTLVVEAFISNTTQKAEVEIKNRSFSFVIRPVPEFDYVNLYGRDITERKRAEKEIKDYAEDLEVANEELRDFTFTASHDLQEPLRKVIMFGDRLETAWSGNQKKEGLAYIGRMQHSAFRMRQLVEDLLEFSRTTGKSGDFEFVDLEAVVAEVVLDLEVQIEESQGAVKMEALPTLNADKSQMLQLFQNLISNGLKYVQPGQPPLVSIKSISLPSGYWKILVEDNGIGFDRKYQDLIFKPFERLHTSEEYLGSGMGLAICKKIVSRHKGSITAESSTGRGARFAITLPGK